MARHTFQSHWKNMPAHGPHTIGQGHDKVSHEPHIGSHIPTSGGELLGAAPKFHYGAKTNSSDDERGPPSRYCNPSGFFGLYGNEPNKNFWMKDSGVREVKRGNGMSAGDGYAVQGLPFGKRKR